MNELTYEHNDSQESAPGWGDTHPHLTIRASAGSGKTYQLSTRYLFLLRHGVAPRSILATTFTRKAAGEVLGRVVTRLADAAGDKNKRAELSDALKGPTLGESDCKVMLRTLARSLHRLSISTIDGFFNKIAQSFRHELDLPPEPVLIDEQHPVAVQLRLDAIEAMLADDDLPTLVTLLRQLHHDSAARSVTDAIDSIVKDLYDTYREAPDRGVWSRLKPLNVLDEDRLLSALGALEDAADDLPPNKHWRNAYDENHHAALDRDWERFISKGLVKKIVEGGESFQRVPITEQWLAVFEPLIGHAGGVMIRRVAVQTLATHDLLRRFDEHYTALRRRQGVLLFSDLTHKLARELPALGGGVMEDVYFRLDGRVTHLLLDEFQDTSLAQWSVLEPFAQEVASTADGTRSLFVVGDTKQAIYGWRGGVAELFDHVEESLALGEESRQTLSLSYRSSEVVLGAVNRVFLGLADNTALAEDAGTARRWHKGFQKHEAKRDLPGHVTLETSTAGDNPGDNDADGDGGDDGAAALPAGAHEVYVAGRVEALFNRPGGAGSIGVLVSRNATASRLIFELGRLGLPVSGEGGSRVTDSPAVSAVLSALVMADHPGDTASVFHVVNSPLGAVVGLDSTQGPGVLRASLNIRRSLLTKGYAQTIADWTREIAPSVDARGLLRLTQLIELADRAESGDALRPSRFVALAESARVAELSPSPIRVMTVHGAKGLEFDTVVLAELDRRLSDRSAVLVERDGPTGDITGVYRNPSRQVRALDEKLEAAAEAQRATGLMDDLCALYVAMTRAKQALHMVVTPLKLTRSGKIASKGLCFASILRDALCDVEETLDGEQVLYEHGDPAWRLAGGKPQAAEAEAAEPKAEAKGEAVTRVRLAQPAGAPRRSWPTVRPSSRPGGSGGSEGSGEHAPAAALMDLQTQDTAAMRYGTLIHAWLELVGFLDEDGRPSDDELKRIADRVMPGADPTWIGAQMDRLDKILKGPGALELLARGGASELWRERGFAVQDGRALLRGVFDRVSVYRDDRGDAEGALLVDFKTDRVGPGGVRALSEHYRPQMLAYRRALMKVLSLDGDAVKMKLWFVGCGEVVDLSAVT